jgi:DtxR family transcriptional regulator, Mn-dependent transcriptional regulator
MLPPLSHNVQDYLKTIYHLTREGAASTTEIAERLKVSPASVTSMIKRLSELKLVTHKSYKGVVLTLSGRKIALEIIRHQRLLETYLASALGYTWDEVLDESERLEHHISEVFEQKIAALLGEPAICPHGAPIPTIKGTIAPMAMQRLNEAEARMVMLQRVSTRDRELLRTLSAKGIALFTILEIVEKTDEGCTLRKRGNRTSFVITTEQAQLLFVEELP